MFDLHRYKPIIQSLFHLSPTALVSTLASSSMLLTDLMEVSLMVIVRFVLVTGCCQILVALRPSSLSWGMNSMQKFAQISSIVDKATQNYMTLRWRWKISGLQLGAH